MVKFSNSVDARSAFRSADAVFNNRFIKVYWGSIGKRVFFGKNTHHKPACRENIPAAIKKPTPIKRATIPPVLPRSDPVKTISVIQREQMMKEVKLEHKKLAEMLANQKSLLKQLETVTLANEKNAIKELVKLSMFNSTELRKSINEKQNIIKHSQSTTKVNMPVNVRVKSMSPRNSLGGGGGGPGGAGGAGGGGGVFNIRVSSDDENEV